MVLVSYLQIVSFIHCLSFVAIAIIVLCIQVMVSHKVLEFGDDGYKLPPQARASRSVRVNGLLLFSVSGLFHG